MGWKEKLSAAKNKVLFLKLFFSYMLVLLIPICLLSAVSYFSIINYTKEKIRTANLARLQLVQNDMEELYKEAKNIAMSLISDVRLDNIYGINAANMADSYENVNRLQDFGRLLGNFKGIKTTVDSIYVYNKKEQFIISTETENSRDKFFDTDWIDQYDGLGKDDIVMAIRTKPSDFNVFGERNKTVQPDSKGADLVTIVFPLNYTRIRGLIAINMDYGDFFQALVSGGSQGDVFYVLDGDGTVIYSGEDKDSLTEAETASMVSRIMNEREYKGSFTLSTGFGEDMVLFSKSGLNSLTLVDRMDGGMLFDKVQFFKMLILLLSMSITFGGLVLAYVMSRKIYSPVQKVLDGLKYRILSDSGKRRNELSIIYDVMNQMIQKEQETEKLIDMNGKKLRELQVIGLVTGQIGEAEAEPEPAFLEECCACIIVSIDRFRLFSRNYTGEEQYYCKSRILKGCNEVVNLHAKGLATVIEANEIVVLASVKREEADRFREIAASICSGILQDVCVIQDLSVSIGIGSLAGSRKGIRESYLESKRAIQYRLLYGHRCTVHYEDICKRVEEYGYPVEKENRIINLLKSDSRGELGLAVDALIADVHALKETRIGYDSIIKTVIQLVSRTMEYMAAKNVNPSDICLESGNVYFELMGLETLEDVRDWLLSFFDRVLAGRKEHEQYVENEKHIRRVLELVERNYQWSDLSIEWIAEQLDLSYSHLRRIFKNAIGENFIDYVNKKRISLARQLLLETELTMKEVAVQSGYNNDQCFTRYFKRYEGITPGRFRVNETNELVLQEDAAENSRIV